MRRKISFFEKLNPDRFRRYILYAGMLITLSAYIFFSAGKQGYFIDELYSYGLANSDGRTDIDEYGIYDRLTDGRVFDDYMTVKAGEGFDYKAVYENQIGDVHPPLYYIFLHTVCSLTPGRFSKWSGLILNFIIHAFNLLIFFKLLKLIFKDEEAGAVLACAALIFYAALPMTVSSLIYIRMYMLLTALLNLYAYIHMRLYLMEDGLEGLKGRGLRLNAAAFLTLTAGALTQYFFLIPAFFTSLAYLIYLIYLKRFRRGAAYSVIMLAALISAAVIFPFFISQLAGGENGYADTLISSARAGIMIKLINNLISFVSNINYGFFSRQIGIAAAGFLLLAVYAWINTKKNPADSGIYMNEKGGSGINKTDKLVLIISAVSACSIAVLLFAVWVPASRYYYPVSGLLSIIPVYIIYRAASFAGKKKAGYIYMIAAAAVLCMNVYGYASSLNSEYDEAVPVEYLYLKERDIIKRLREEDAYIILLSDYKNAAVTESLQELREAEKVYISSYENLDKAMSSLSAGRIEIQSGQSENIKDENQAADMKTEALPLYLIIDSGKGLWGSGYEPEMILKDFEKLGYKKTERIDRKNLTEIYYLE